MVVCSYSQRLSSVRRLLQWFTTWAWLDGGSTTTFEGGAQLDYYDGEWVGWDQRGGSAELRLQDAVRAVGAVKRAHL